MLNHQKSCIKGFILPLIWILTGCSGDNTADEIRTADLPPVNIHHVLSIEETGDFYFDRVSELLADPQGRIYLPDQRAHSIYVFNQDGEYLNTIGREGGGPGEFFSFLNLFVDQNSRLFAFDIRLNRTTIFSESGGQWDVDTIFTTEGARAGIITADQSDNVVFRQGTNRFPQSGLFWMESELAAGTLDSGVERPAVLTLKTDKFVMLDDGSTEMRQVPFGRKDITGTRSNGDVYVVWTDQFNLKIYDSTLELKDSLSLNLASLPVTSEERENLIYRFADSYRSRGITDPFIPLMREHIPQTKPVIRAMHITHSGRLILQTYDSPEYLIVSPDGVPLGSFDMEEGVNIHYADDERLYGIYRDDEGVQIRVFDYHTEG